MGYKSYDDLKKHPFFKGIDWENLHRQTPPPIRPLSVKLVFEEDVIAEEEDKRKKMQDEEAEKWLELKGGLCTY